MGSARVMANGYLDGNLITEDCACPECGYNLKGLREFMPCPECGRSGAGAGSDSFLPTEERAGKRKRVRELPLDRMPRGYLETLHAALAFASLSSIGLVVGSLPAFSGSVTAHLARAAVGAVWFFAVLLTLRPRPEVVRRMSDGTVVNEWPTLRAVAGFAQLGWVVAPLCSIVGFPAIDLFMRAVGILGWAVYAWYLANLGDWGRHESMGDRLRRSSFGIAVAGVLGWTLLYLSELGIPALQGLGFFAILLLIIWSLAIFLFLWSVYELMSMARWAIVNQEEVLARDERMAERAREHAERVRREEAARLASLPSAPEPGAHSAETLLMNSTLEPGGPPPRTTHAGEHRIDTPERPADPYRLEGD